MKTTTDIDRPTTFEGQFSCLMINERNSLFGSERSLPVQFRLFDIVMVVKHATEQENSVGMRQVGLPEHVRH